MNVKLVARLVNINPSGPDKSGCYNEGLSRVHIENGHVYYAVPWGLDGTDIPLSNDIQHKNVAGYVLTDYDCGSIPFGTYELRVGQETARGRVNPWRANDGTTELYLSCKTREGIIRLYKALKEGRIRPTEERRALFAKPGQLAELIELRKRVIGHKFVLSRLEQENKSMFDLAESQAKQLAVLNSKLDVAMQKVGHKQVKKTHLKRSTAKKKVGGKTAAKQRKK